MADAENGQKIDPDATNVFDEEEFDDRIPYSVSYFMICIVLPVMNGLPNSFAWSAYALYARKNGWNLSLAGLAISIGCGGRLIVQQVIFRAGIWTCFIFAVVQLTVASMAIAYPAEAIVVYVQVACIPAFDVTVAIEGLAFDTWSDSEAQVGQAQSTVLSIFTIAYAMAATFGGVIYDAGSWTGISLFHLTCSLVQLLVFVAQPAMLKSFWEFIHRIRGDDDDDEDDEDEDEVKELGDQVTSIVPGPKVNVVPVSEASPLGPSAQSGPSGASGPSGPSGGKAEEMAALPGAVEEEAGPRATAPEKETQIVLPEKEVLPSDDPDGVQNAAHSEGDARAARAQASRRASARSAASTKSSRRRKTANSESPEDDEEHERRSRALISPNLARSSIMTGHSSRSSVSSHVSQPRRRNQRLTVATHGTLATHRTGHTHASGRTANTTRSTRTMETVMTNLSKFTALTEMGEHFQYNFGIQNGLRPHIATNAVEMAVQSDDEEDAPAPRKTEVVGPRKSTAEKNKGLSKDLYVVAAMVAMISFSTNLSYGVEWTTFAIFFAEQHGWANATWAGICQTSGDLFAGLVMGLLKNIPGASLDELEGIRKLWHGMIAHPYLLVVFSFGWAILNAGLCVPSLPVAIASQVIMGTLYVFSTKGVTDLNRFYSLGDPKVFLQLQVQCKNMDAIGCLVAGGCSFPLYEYNPIAPYVLCSGVSLLSCIVVMIGFCCRIGFGNDIETAEARRARRLGLRRVSEWKSARSMRSEAE